MIYDIITWNGEEELFEIRYNILKDYVDEFRVVEFDKTFSGKSKYSKDLWRGSWPFNNLPVKYYMVNEDIYSKYEDLARASPNTNYGKGAEHWVREFSQKESIRDCLTDLQDDDIVFIGDADEVWEPGHGFTGYVPTKIPLRVYSYWLNNKSSERFLGTLVSKYKFIRDECLNHLRSNPPACFQDELGWHFTSLGGYEKVRRKLTDSYTEESYATKEVLDNLEKNIEDNKDFLGRDFTYTLDESQWPSYLKEHREKYKRLLRL